VRADEKVHEVETILWPVNRMDIAHIYAAYLNDCEYFVTEDKTDFIDGGRREALESLLGVKVRQTKELLDDLAQEGYLAANDEPSPWPWWAGYLVVLAGAAGFVVSCFVPFLGGGLLPPPSNTVSLWQQGPPGDSVASVLSQLLLLFGGVATVAVLAIAGLTRRGPLAAPTVLAAAVVAWSLAWIGLLIGQATIGLGITLEWGFWLQALSVGVVVIGTVLAVAHRAAGARS
jgi:hypothetical protein